MDIRCRNWCFTIDNYTEDDKNKFLSLKNFRYVVVGFEVGESSTPQLHGFLCVSNAIRLSSLKKICAKSDWEMATGSIEQHRAYCTKSGCFEERGKIPMTNKRKGEISSERWLQAKKAAIEGRLEDIPGDIYFQYYRSIKEIKKDHMP